MEIQGLRDSPSSTTVTESQAWDFSSALRINISVALLFAAGSCDGSDE